MTNTGGRNAAGIEPCPHRDSVFRSWAVFGLTLLAIVVAAGCSASTSGDLAAEGGSTPTVLRDDQPAAEPAATAVHQTIASDRLPQGHTWPASWADPTNGVARAWHDWGFNRCGPTDGDYGGAATSWYFEGRAHLGVDSQGAPGGTEIRAIADGVVLDTGPIWGEEWGAVVLVEHRTDSGQTFIAIYGHVAPESAVATGPITANAPVGDLLSEQPFGDHLHFGIVVPERGQPWETMRIRGATECAPLEEGATYGAVHPIEFLTSNSPAA